MWKQPKHYVLVLWGQDFDEIAASIFVGELRRLGFLVKIVALNMPQTVGEHGVALAPDITLDRAVTMAMHSRCVILPCALAAIRKFSYDPRLAEFLHLSGAAKATFVTDAKVASYLAEEAMLPLAPEATVIYPEVEELIAFVREVLDSLLRR